MKRLHKYPSGIQSIFYKDKRKSNVSTVYWSCPVGSIHERPGEEGLSHLLEHFFFRGSSKYPDGATVADAFNRIGAFYNAFTYKYKTSFYIKVPNERLQYALAIFNDLLCCPLFPEEFFEKEKMVVMEEIRRERDNFYSQCEEEMDAILFRDTPYAHPITASLGQIESMTYERLVEYKRRHYIPKRMIVSVISSMDAKELHTILGSLSMFTDASLNTNQRLDELVVKEPLIGKQFIHFKKRDTIHRHILMGIRLNYPMKPTEYVSNRIFTSLIAGHSSSRMFRRLREQNGISYSSSGTMNYYPHVASIYFYTSVDPRQYKKAFDLMMSCFEDPVSEEEFEFIKGFCRGRLTIENETNEAQLQFDLDEILYPNKAQLGIDWKSYCDLYETLTYREFLANLKKLYRDNKVQIVVLGKVS